MNKQKEHKEQHKETKFELNFMALTLVVSWFSGTIIVLAFLAIIVKWAIQYIF